MRRPSMHQSARYKRIHYIAWRPQAVAHLSGGPPDRSCTHHGVTQCCAPLPWWRVAWQGRIVAAASWDLSRNRSPSPTALFRLAGKPGGYGAPAGYPGQAPHGTVPGGYPGQAPPHGAAPGGYPGQAPPGGQYGAPPQQHPAPGGYPGQAPPGQYGGGAPAGGAPGQYGGSTPAGGPGQYGGAPQQQSYGGASSNASGISGVIQARRIVALCCTPSCDYSCWSSSSCASSPCWRRTTKCLHDS